MRVTSRSETRCCRTFKGLAPHDNAGLGTWPRRSCWRCADSQVASRPRAATLDHTISYFESRHICDQSFRVPRVQSTLLMELVVARARLARECQASIHCHFSSPNHHERESRYDTHSLGDQNAGESRGLLDIHLPSSNNLYDDFQSRSIEAWNMRRDSTRYEYILGCLYRVSLPHIGSRSSECATFQRVP
jgi:hypothetical protein